MEKIKKYIPFILLILYFSIKGSFPPKGAVSIEWIGIVITILGTIILFELIERTRPKRMEKWKTDPPGKYAHMMKFSLYLGLPLSALLIFVIHSKADILLSVLFITLPLIIIFGWIGFVDWKNCSLN